MKADARQGMTFRRTRTLIERAIWWRGRMARYATVPVNKEARSEVLGAWLFRSIGRRSPSVAVQVGDLWYFVPTNDMLGKQTFLTGGFEHEVMELAMEVVKDRTGRPPLAGKIFIDIGANIGTSCIPAIRVFGASDAIAFEPASQNLRLLRANRAANELDDRIRIIPLALSDRSGSHVLETGDENCGDYRIRVTDEHGSIGEHKWATEEVRTATFDDIAGELRINLDDVGMVWMDTQGHEAHILAGASSLTDSNVPIVTEYWPYGLRRAGALEQFHDIVEKCYGTVIDLRGAMVDGKRQELTPVDIGTIRARYHPDRYWQYTDLVLVKQPSA